MKKPIDLSGRKFGRLTVMNRTSDHIYPNGRHDIVYSCQCDCGKFVDVLAIHLRSGHTTSCGCFREDTARENMTTHGHTYTRLHCIWKNMKQRCYNPKHKNYDVYGGRGITICDEWIRDFASFERWALNNGYNDNLSIDRINANQGYSPDNCRWATQREQCNNTRRTILVEISGETHSMKEWCEIMSLQYGTVMNRVHRGMDCKSALLYYRQKANTH